MSHIYIYSPSSAQRDKAAFRRGVARLQALGHEVEVDPDATAGNDIVWRFEMGGGDHPFTAYRSERIESFYAGPLWQTP